VDKVLSGDLRHGEILCREDDNLTL